MAKRKQVQVIAAIEQQPEIVRVAPYVRVSSMSDDQLHSFYVQYNYYYDLVTKKPEWQLVDIYADEGLTGTKTDKRDEFNRLIRDCRAGKIDRILVKSVSRFARNVEDCLKYIRELKTLGVAVYFEEELIDTDMMSDEMILAIRGVQAQHESMMNSRSVRWSYTKRMQSGEFVSSHAPIGYTLQKSMLMVNEETAPIVRRIFREYLDGKGIQKIAMDLNDDGLKTAENCNWTVSAVKRVLKNEKYTGNALLQKTYTTASLPFKQRKNNGEAPQYYIESSHEAIISNTDYQRVQELFQWRKEFYSNNNERQIYPLSKKLVCAACGRSFRRKVLTNGAVAWECSRHNESKELCHVPSVKEQDVYTAFITLYNRLKLRQQQVLVPMYKYLERLYVPPQDMLQEIAALNAEIGKTARTLTRMSSLFEKGILNETLYIKNRHPMEQQLASLRKQRSALQNKAAADEMREIEKLMRIVQAGPRVMTDFNVFIFENMVEKILVFEENKLAFQLVSGLILEEAIDRRKRR